MSNKYNRNTSLIKSNERELKRYNLRFYYTPYVSTKSKKLIYLALDSCIIIDMVKLLRGTAPIKRSPEYFTVLKNILNRNVFSKNGRRNKQGDLVFCITPTVLKEISNEKGEIFDCLKKFLNERVMILKIDDSYKKHYSKTISQLTNKYYENYLFVNDKNELTTDAFIVAEASFFNLTLLSRDKHICINIRDIDPTRKIEKIKFINRRVIQRQKNGPQAEPSKLKYLLKMIPKWKENEEMMPEMEHTEYLQPEVQKLKYNLDNHQPINKTYENKDL